MTVAKGLDYSSGRPDLAAVKRAGYTFVVRYLSGGHSSKDITTTEAHALEAAGIPFALVWERDAAEAKGGLAAGRAAGAVAKTQLAALGLTGVRPVVYVAIDFDAQSSELRTVVAYVNGFASVVGKSRTGVYGSRQVLDACHTAAACPWYWHTAAWGTPPPYAQLRQVGFDLTVGGAQVDVNEAWADDFGQFPLRAPASTAPSRHELHLLHLARVGVVKWTAHLRHLAHVLRGKK